MRLINADELITAFPCGESIRTESVRATINHMLTIEVSEDAISRDYVEEQLQQIEDITAMVHIDLGEDPYDETEEITMPISTVRKIFRNAPSVIPKAKEGEWIPCEVLKGLEDYEVLDIEPHAFELQVLLDKPKEAKK